MSQQALILIKPDGIVKSLTGNIISMLSETRGRIVGAKMIKVSRELAEKHYEELKESQIQKHGEEKGNAIFEEVLKYIQGAHHTDRVLAMVYEGEDMVQRIRELVGKTNPEDADPISIRGKYGRINSKTGVFENVIHASDSENSAKKEIQLWFKPEELTSIIYPTRIAEVSGEIIVWDN